jgi:phage shock protein PspC (stress-responsive transcriptional regulator)
MTTTPPEAPAGGSDPHDQAPHDQAPHTQAPHTQAPDTQGQGPRVSAAEIRDVTRLRRTILSERKIAGVAGGLARHFDIDPLIVRVAFVVLALFGGSGVLLYAALWLLLPEDGAETAAINLDERSLGVALVGVGVIAVLTTLGAWSGARWVSWPLAVVLLVVLLFYTARGRRPAVPSSGTYPPVAYASAAVPVGGGAPTPTPGGPAWTGPVGPAPAPLPPRPRDPRKSGPILFWFTLALVTLAMGTLGMIDVGGADIAASAYPALATAIAGLMLLVGAFYGRAGGIIALGLLTATALAGTTVGEHVDGQHSVIRPTTSAELSDTYSQAAGELVVDLSAVADPVALDGRRITLEQGAGRIEVVVPDTVDVVTTASVGAGNIGTFGATREGLGIDVTNRHDVPNERATLTLDVQMGVGEILIHTGSQAG